MFQVIVNQVVYEFGFYYEIYGKQVITHCYVLDVNGNPVVIKTKEKYIPVKSSTYCHPKDIFSKIIGRKIAMKRILEILKFNKLERAVVWEEYKRTHRYTFRKSNERVSKNI